MYRRLCAKVLPELIPARSRILVALSGGPDSVALSHVLWRYSRDAQDQEIALVLSHVNHGARPESEEEARMVMGLAKEWGIPCLVHQFDAKAYAKKVGLSFQEAAREWRYARWQEDMERENCRLLATAHHLGDQAETILYRFLRGSGSAGLAGIYPKRDGVIRPLLSVTKEEILAYCQEEGLPFALDRSNNESVYDRNRIRLELIPLLADRYNPRILEVLGRTGELMRWDEEYLESLAQKEWDKHRVKENPSGVCLSLEVFRLAPALLSRLLRRAAAAAGGDPRGLGFIYVEQILKSEGTKGWKQNLPGIMVKIDHEGLWFISSATPPAQGGIPENPAKPEKRKSRKVSQENELCVEVPWGRFAEIRQIGVRVGLFIGSLDILEAGQKIKGEDFTEEESETDGKTLTARNLQEESLREGIEQGMVERTMVERTLEVKKSGFEFEGHETAEEAFDLESVLKLTEPLVLRTRRPGDKMWFRGVGHKPLKKVYQEEDVPVRKREKMLLLASGAEVLWLPMVKRSGVFRPKRAEKTVYCVMCWSENRNPEIP